MKNYYEVLGLNRNVTSRQIRKKTIELGKQLHPKINHSDLIDEPKDFIDVVEACEVLNEDNSRRIYDLLLDNLNGIKSTSSISLEKHQEYINAISKRGRKRGEHYAKSKLKEFKEDYKVINWWDIPSIIQNLIP